jgi:hypothetical protein
VDLRRAESEGDVKSGEGFVMEMTESLIVGIKTTIGGDGDKSEFKIAVGVDGEETVGKSRVLGKGLVNTKVVLLDGLVDK